MRYKVDGETPYIVDTSMHQTYSTKSDKFPEEMVDLLNEKQKEIDYLKRKKEHYRIILEEFIAVCRKAEHDKKVTCEDCINCKTNTTNEEYNYCELYNDYFLKEDKEQICSKFEMGMIQNGK